MFEGLAVTAIYCHSVLILFSQHYPTLPLHPRLLSPRLVVKGCNTRELLTLQELQGGTSASAAVSHLPVPGQMKKGQKGRQFSGTCCFSVYIILYNIYIIILYYIILCYVILYYIIYICEHSGIMNAHADLQYLF